jgi:hypothetical protein
MGLVGQAHGNAFGVFGKSDLNTGVVGESVKGHGVVGQAHADAFGVFGKSDLNTGVVGQSVTGQGVVGIADGLGFGVLGQSAENSAVVGESVKAFGVFCTTENGEGAFKAVHKGGGVAGIFDGDLVVTGHCKLAKDVDIAGNVHVEGDVQLVGADVAEQFDVVGELAADPGDVVVLAGDDQVRVSDEPYDRRVAGVVSGAGSYRPALVLDQREDATRRPLALTGKVWCKVDADCGPVTVGDMLTTSPTAGHAMRASDPARAFGAVIGKALGSLQSGRGLLPVLVALQ